MLAERAAAALENARLFAREKELAQYLRSLNQALARASARLDPHTVVQTIAECLVEYCGAAFARLWLTDESGEYLILKASAGLYTQLDGSRSRISIAEDPYKLGVIARQRKPLITNQIQQESQFDREWAKSQGLLAFAGYPILDKQNLLGVVALFSRQPLSDEILDVLGAFVNQAAIVLSNTHLYQETQQRLAELAALFDVSSALRGVETVAEMLPVILKTTIKVVGSDAGVILLRDPGAGGLAPGSGPALVVRANAIVIIDIFVIPSLRHDHLRF